MRLINVNDVIDTLAVMARYRESSKGLYHKDKRYPIAYFGLEYKYSDDTRFILSQATTIEAKAIYNLSDDCIATKLDMINKKVVRAPVLYTDPALIVGEIISLYNYFSLSSKELIFNNGLTGDLYNDTPLMLVIPGNSVFDSVFMLITNRFNYLTVEEVDRIALYLTKSLEDLDILNWFNGNIIYKIDTDGYLFKFFPIGEPATLRYEELLHARNL